MTPKSTLSLAFCFTLSLASIAQAQSFADRLRAKALETVLSGDLDVRNLSLEQRERVMDALIMGVDYGNQAKENEAAGYALAHQKAAYDWGYAVGDPQIVKMVRLYWEGVQLGVFAIGDLQQGSGTKTDLWKSVESAVGGTGKDYDVDDAYVDDIFSDVQITVDGAEAAQSGHPHDFDTYSLRF